MDSQLRRQREQRGRPAAGNWEGDYDAAGETIGKFAGEAHDWDPGPGTQVLNPVSDDSAGVPTILQWNDPQGRSGNDYDLYAVDGSGNVTGFFNDTQDGNGPSADGAWNFHVVDAALLDVGSVRAFTLHVAGFVG